MKVSYEWLQDYIEIELTPEGLADKLTMSGIEVESISCLDPGLEGVVVGKVLSIERHPRAEKLYLVQVDIRGEALGVVVGIANFQVGDLVPVALPGALLPGGQRIAEADLRGVTSRGMLCSAGELGLEFCHPHGILVLDQGFPVGEEISRALGLKDPVLELGLTPNRADCLGLLGVAREVSALTGRPLKPAFPPMAEDLGEKARELAEIKILDEDLCPRYSARIVREVNIEPSPLWLQRRLMSSGIRPISSVVDATNYVMWETGQPLHAFDYDRVKDHTIIIRRAYPGEKLVTLDGQERKLEEDMLVIADPSGPIALAGVMGGLDTEITPGTSTVLLESASFHPASIRRTSRDLGLRSEASLRFEKGVDPNGTVIAADRVAQVLVEISGGRLLEGVLDRYPVPRPSRTLLFQPGKANQVLGLGLPGEEMKNIFHRLQFKVKELPVEAGKEAVMEVEVPTRRPDITREIDLVEEVARVYGYHHIGTTLPRGPITQGRKNREQKLQDLAREIMVSCGLCEAVTYSFINPGSLDKLRLDPGDPLREAIPLSNPLSEEQGIMRTTLAANLLQVLHYNLNRNQYDQGIFELGSVFLPGKALSPASLPRERSTLALALMGDYQDRGWKGEPVPADFFLLKGMVELLLDRLGINDYQFVPVHYPLFHPTRAAELRVAGEKAGILGEVHGKVITAFDLEDRVYLGELDYALISQRASLEVDFKALPRFPAVLRDMALVVKEEVPAGDLAGEILAAGGELVEGLKLFDLYRGDQVPPGHKSLAYSIVYRAPGRTLTDGEVNQVHQEITGRLAQKFAARLRSQ